MDYVNTPAMLLEKSANSTIVVAVRGNESFIYILFFDAYDRFQERSFEQLRKYFSESLSVLN